MPLVSIVVPCKNEEQVIPDFLEESLRAISTIRAEDPSIQAEFLFVDDGSTDGTIERLNEIAPTSSAPIRWISLSRSFGKEAAIMAGLEHAKGDFVALIDADLQDPPSLLIEMCEAVIHGDCDMAVARRKTRAGEPVFKSWFSKAFYKLFSKLTGIELLDGERDYRLMRRQVVDAFLRLGEQNRFSKGIFAWLGFKVSYCEYEYTNRKAGTTKWSFGQLLRYAIDGITSFSSTPLLLASVSGVVLCLISIIAMLVIVVRAVLFGDPVAGWPSMVSIILLLGGLQFLYLGIIGQYLAKTYNETKVRPLYCIKAQSENEHSGTL